MCQVQGICGVDLTTWHSWLMTHHLRTNLGFAAKHAGQGSCERQQQEAGNKCDRHT